MNCQKPQHKYSVNIQRLGDSYNLFYFASCKVLTEREAESPFGWRENESAISQGLLDKQLTEKLCRGI